MEEWRDVKGYEGLYQISNLGTLKRLPRFINTKHKTKSYQKEKIIKPYTTLKGYKRASLKNEEGARRILIHRLVAEAWIDNPHKKTQVNHIDGVKSNNNVSNLEWCTNQENAIHAFKSGLRKSPEGLNHGGSKFTKKDIIEIRSKSKNITYYCNKFSVSRQTIWKVQKGITYKNI